MSKLYLGSIDLNKIDKSLIVDKDKDGKPFNNGAKYLNLALWINDEADQYGNHASLQTKDKDDNKTYIGNFKEFQREGNQQSAPKVQESTTDDNSDLPF